MSIKLSTGLRNSMLGSSGAAGAIGSFFVKIYSGTVPDTADEAVSSDSTLLVTISLGGDGSSGLSFDSPASGVILKNSSEVWSGTVATSGTPAYYRLSATDDDGTASATQARVQGTVGTSGDLKLGVTTLTADDPQTIDYYQLSLLATGS